MQLSKSSFEASIFVFIYLRVQALADMMEKNTEAKWGNWIGYVLLPFTIALRDDPLDYIREAKTTIDRKKHSLEAIYTFSIAELVLKFFGIKVYIINLLVILSSGCLYVIIVQMP